MLLQLHICILWTLMRRESETSAEEFNINMAIMFRFSTSCSYFLFQPLPQPYIDIDTEEHYHNISATLLQKYLNESLFIMKICSFQISEDILDYCSGHAYIPVYINAMKKRVGCLCVCVCVCINDGNSSLPVL